MLQYLKLGFLQIPKNDEHECVYAKSRPALMPGGFLLLDKTLFD